ncbi:hypothetical protein Nizo2264_0917 [Lactiplantibacillus plantarum]|nr:hypothetical protein Nizo2264_0917 [Lactiplantibacillus plantarum]
MPTTICLDSGFYFGKNGQPGMGVGLVRNLACVVTGALYSS